MSCSHAGPRVRSRPRVIDQLHNVFLQAEVVAGTWKERYTRNHGGTAATVCDALQEFDLLWDEFSPAAQARIVALLVNRIDTHTQGRDIHAPVDGLNGLNGLTAEIAALTNGEKHEQYLSPDPSPKMGGPMPRCRPGCMGDPVICSDPGVSVSTRDAHRKNVAFCFEHSHIIARLRLDGPMSDGDCSATEKHVCAAVEAMEYAACDGDPDAYRRCLKNPNQAWVARGKTRPPAPH